VPSTGRAYELFLRGNDLRAGAGSTSQLIAARDLYKSAVMEDPQFAPAWACLGRVYRVMGKFGHDDPDGCRRLAEDAFAKALALAPHLPLTHHLYTYLQLEEPGGGVRAMERLLGEIAGGARDPQLYGGLVAACRMGGLLDASLAAHREARRLDGQIRTSVHYTYLALADYGRAIAHDEDEVPGVRWMAIAELGNLGEAIAGLREIESHGGRGHETYWITSLRASLEGERAGVVHGIRHSASASFRDPEGLYINARPAGLIGEADLAMPMLARAATGYWVVEQWENDRAWASFRQDPRFQTLLEQVRAGHQHARERFLAADGEKLLGVTLA